MYSLAYEPQETIVYQEYATFDVATEGDGFVDEMVVRCKGVREDNGEEVEYFIQDVLEVISVKSGKDGKIYAYPNSVNRLLPLAKKELAPYINSDKPVTILEEVA